MNKKMVILALLLIGAYGVTAQNTVKEKLSEADNAFQSGSLEDARFALQQSLVELDKLIGAEILKQLPTELSGLTAEVEDDAVSGGTGFSGVYVKRYYPGENQQDIDIEIVTNSPLLTMINASLTNPLLASMSGGDQSVVKIDGYKSLLRKEEASNGGDRYEISIPINDSMITVNCNGFSQSEALNIANALGIRAIAKIIGAGQ